jgi:hypothetical protein
MNTNAKYFLLGCIFTIFIVAMGLGLYILGKSQVVNSEKSIIPQPTLSLQSSTKQLLPQQNVPPKDDSPKIYIEDAGGAISDTDKDQIVKRIITPYIDYYKDAGQGKLVTFTVSLNTNPNNVTYPFAAVGEFDTGVKNSFVIEKPGTDISWWTPECMGPCLMTDDFRNKYPEIIKILE